MGHPVDGASAKLDRAVVHYEDLTSKDAGQPDHILQIAWRAQHRLDRLQRRLRARGKPGNVAVVATARELACFLWAAAVAP